MEGVVSAGRLSVGMTREEGRRGGGGVGGRAKQPPAATVETD